MTKTHTAELVNRMAGSGTYPIIIRARDGSTYLDVHVPTDLRDDAGQLCGGAPVRYQYRGGKAVMIAEAAYWAMVA